VRFDRLDLLAFGPFTDYSLDLAPGFNLIYGPNEAGKSTILRAVTGLLYGIPHRSPDNYLHREVRIGAVLQHEGEALEVVRRKGRKNTLLTADGDPVDAGAEARFHRLLSGVGEGLFTTLFGLDHETLRQGAEALLAGRGEVGESLFGAGVGGRGIHAVLTRLEAEAGDLFKATGSRPALNQALRGYKEARKRLRSDTLDASDWHEQQRSLEAIRQELAELTPRQQGLAAEKHRLERVRRNLGPLARWQDLKARRLELGEVAALPEDAAEAHTTARRDLDEGKREVERLEGEITRLRERRDALEVPEDLMALPETTVAALRDRLAGHRRDAAELPRLEGERLALERHQDGDQPAPEVPTETLEEIQRAVARARKLGDPEEDIRHRRAQLEALEAELEQRLSALGLWTGTAEQLAAVPLPPSAAVAAAAEAERSRRDALGALEERRREVQQRRDEVEADFVELQAAGEVATEARLEEARRIRDEAWGAIRTAATAGKLEPAAADRYEAAVAAADELADRLRREAERTAQMAKLEGQKLRVKRREEELDRQEAALEEEARAQAAAWRERWSAVGIEPRTPAEMKEWLGEARSLGEGVIQREEAVAEVKRLEERMGRHRREVESALKPLAGAPVKGESLEGLLERAEAAVEAAEQERRRRREAAELAAQIDTLQRAARDLRQEVAKLVERHLGRKITPQQPFEEAAEELIRRHGEALTAQRDRRSLDADLEEKQEQREAARQSCREAQDRLAALMAAAGVEDEAALRRAEQNAAEAADLDRRRAEVEEQLLTAGDGLSLEDLAAEAREEDADTLVTRLAEGTRELQEAEGRERELRRELGAQEKELEALESRAGAGAAAEEAEEHLAEIRRTAHRYLTLRLAAVLLRREIERYREANEGPILKRAGELFPRLTLGRYRDLKVGFDDGDEPVLRCLPTADEEGEKGVEALSDGTRDQLYLALRLASLERHADHNPPLPLVLDDVLVHFDDARARAALEVLGQVAERFQILFFTHHARLEELALEALGENALRRHHLGTA
jgi:uncharacterized protein YhaN